MQSQYNRIAGQSVERIAALSDGIFAVAMTLLVLEIRPPAPQAIHSEHDLWRALAPLTPRLVMVLMSFLTAGIFWVGQQTQLNAIERSNRDFSWLHIAFMCFVAMLPFSTSLLAEFITFRIALIAYWSNIFMLGMLLYFSWGCAVRSGLVRADTPPEVPAVICRRILIAQSLYAFGALLCVINTYVSIAFIVLVQLNYAIAPRLRRRTVTNALSET